MSIPKPLLGQGAGAVWLEELRRQSRRNLVVDSPDIRIARSQHGTSLHINRRNALAGSRVWQYLLTDASKGDYFIARSLDRTFDTTDPENPVLVITIGADDIYIAKPFHLRQSTFDRDVLNAADPGNIGTVDEITYDIVVESWDGATFSSDAKFLSFEYKSATFRIATDETDSTPANWTTQKQTIIPRFVPALLDETDPKNITTASIAPTILHAIDCDGLGITRPTKPEEPAGAQTDVTLLALSDGWAWSKTS